MIKIITSDNKSNKKSKKKVAEVILDDADKIQTIEDGYIIMRTVYEGEADYLWELYQHGEEWKEIDELVALYQEQFTGNPSYEEIKRSNAAGMELLDRFHPLFKKYLLLLKTGQINFRNAEQKQFVRLFINEPYLLKSFNRNTNADYRVIVTQKFNFLIEGYGHQSEDEILDDLHTIFLTLVKRYKNVGRSFCCYVYNLFKYEVARHIQKYQKNPLNFHYKVTPLENCSLATTDDYHEVEDTIYEDEQGLPDDSWIRGETCSEIFADFTNEDRMIFSKYYLQDWNDSQIAEYLGIHINTANQRRKSIVRKLCDILGMDPKDIKRHRKSGKKAIRLVK